MASVNDKLQKLQSFMKDVKQIEKRDEVLTNDKQIERLTKPGSKYLNLNPYETEGVSLGTLSMHKNTPAVFKMVLQVSPSATPEEIKKTFRKLSILVHPDKNPNDSDRAQKAFEAVNEANKTLQDADKVRKIKFILEEADALIERQLKEKRKEVKKISPLATIPEDDNPGAYARFKRAITVKLFADSEIKKQEVVDRQQQEKKRERENELDSEDSAKRQKDYEKKWDESRNARVSDWRSFQKNASKKEKKKKSTFKSFRPPSMKPEQKLNK